MLILENDEFIGSLLSDYAQKLETKITAFIEEEKVNFV
jgi:hypothetical protein